jgi:hypothetical protein
MAKPLMIALLLLGSAESALSRAYQPTRYSCATVRSYVAAYGVEQARQIALAYGMTASEERQAWQCLARR